MCCKKCWQAADSLKNVKQMIANLISSLREDIPSRCAFACSGLAMLQRDRADRDKQDRMLMPMVGQCSVREHSVRVSLKTE